MTKDKKQPRVGEVYTDQDKRMGGRRIQVMKIDDEYAFCFTNAGDVRIRLNRLSNPRLYKRVDIT